VRDALQPRTPHLGREARIWGQYPFDKWLETKENQESLFRRGHRVREDQTRERIKQKKKQKEKKK
jgi:hypothetical protein